MKKFIKVLMLMLIVPVAFIVCGCDSNVKPVSIKSIDKTDSVGLVDTYTVTYTNGKTEQFTIVNGADGEEIYQNITINDLYEEVKKSKPEGYTLINFIDEYLDIQIDSTAIASSKALRSGVSIYVEHEIDIIDYNTKLSVTQKPYGEEINYAFKKSITIGAGAGVIYKLDKANGDAYIITNYHVCFSSNVAASDGIATRFTAYLYGGESIESISTLSTNLNNYNNNCKIYSNLFNYDEQGLPIVNYGYGAINAEYIGGSEQYDIAVLKVTNSEVIKNSDCIEAEVADSDLVTPGTTSIAVGNPGIGGIAVTSGVISVDSQYISLKISDTAVVLREFRVDTPINGGNSGGGLFDSFGRLIGIVNAKYPDASVFENIGYAIPTNVAIRVADSILDNCNGVDRKTIRVMLGVYSKTISSKSVYDSTTGLMRIKEVVAIDNFTTESMLRELGLKVGDVITSVDIINDKGTTHIDIDRVFKLPDAMLLVRVGDCVKINYERGGVAGSITTSALINTNFISID